jgi:hypothetical protein
MDFNGPIAFEAPGLLSDVQRRAGEPGNGNLFWPDGSIWHMGF